MDNVLWHHILADYTNPSYTFTSAVILVITWLLGLNCAGGLPTKAIFVSSAGVPAYRWEVTFLFSSLTNYSQYYPLRWQVLSVSIPTNWLAYVLSGLNLCLSFCRLKNPNLNRTHKGGCCSKWFSGTVCPAGLKLLNLNEKVIGSGLN